MSQLAGGVDWKVSRRRGGGAPGAARGSSFTNTIISPDDSWAGNPPPRLTFSALPSAGTAGSAIEFSRGLAPARSVCYAPWITPISATCAAHGVGPPNPGSAARA